MNTHTARALLDDAVYQVLDNRVFRMLSIVVLCFVATTFLVGIREEGIVLLFGWKTISYADFLAGFGMPVSKTGGHGLHLEILKGAEALFVDTIAGTLGILLCIAATAFFVPQMLEKGTADTLFSKPVSRAALLLARYISGVLFVAALACMLVFGMYVGIFVTSGYSDPTLLWSAVTLVYTFALVHAFSTAVAAITRNSIAAILATLMFFMFNGCIHQIWVGKEHKAAVAAAAPAEGERPAAAARGDDSAIIGALKLTLDVMHFALPKTNDASVLSHRLRTAVTGDERVLNDPAVGLQVKADPEGFTLARPQPTFALDREPAVWTATATSGARPAEIRLSRRTRVTGKNKRQTASAAARELEKSLIDRLSSAASIERESQIADTSTDNGSQTVGGSSPYSDLVRSGVPVGTESIESVSWSEKDGASSVLNRRYFFAEQDWMFEISVVAPATFLPASELDDRMREFLEGMAVAESSPAQMRTPDWYAKQFGWTAPPKFNAFFSIGESLLFAALMLGLAWYRVMRIDF